MKLKLRKIGNSWGVIIPKEVVGVFLESGKTDINIEVGMPYKELRGPEKNTAEISKPLGKEKKVQALREVLSGKKSVEATPLEVDEVLEGEDIVYVEE